MKMSEEKKAYLTTERAGFVVAGQRIPAVPKVGHELLLTEAEAEYEVRQGTIALKEPAEDPAPAPADAAADARKKATKRPDGDVATGA
jgi:hypothetical protein